MKHQVTIKSKLAVLISTILMSASLTVQAADSAFEFSGVVEIDHTTSDASGTKSNDTGISTAELDIATKLGNFDINAVLLAEDIGLTNPVDFHPYSTEYRPDDLHVEELTVSTEVGSLGVTVGQMAMPFGVFPTSIVNDPVTLEIGETKTNIGLVISGKAGDKIEWNIGAFDGTHRSTTASESGFTVNAVMNINDSTSIGGGFLTPQGAAAGGLGLVNLHASKGFGKSTVAVEYMATDDSSINGISLDLGHELNDKTSLGLHYDMAQNLGLLGGAGDYTAYGVGAAYKLKDNVILNLEYLNASEGVETYQHYKVMVAVEF